MDKNTLKDIKDIEDIEDKKSESKLLILERDCLNKIQKILKDKEQINAASYLTNV